MKKYLAIISVFVSVINAPSDLTAISDINKVRSVDELIESSPDILIVKCATTPQPEMVVNDIIESDIEVVSILKGDVKLGPARLRSTFLPRQADLLLIFVGYSSTDQHLTEYDARQDFRVVPLRSIILDVLKDKPLKTQIQMLLEHRLSCLNLDMQKDAEEKKRIEDTLKETK